MYVSCLGAAAAEEAAADACSDRVARRRLQPDSERAARPSRIVVNRGARPGLPRSRAAASSRSRDLETISTNFEASATLAGAILSTWSAEYRDFTSLFFCGQTPLGKLAALGRWQRRKAARVGGAPCRAGQWRQPFMRHSKRDV